MYKKCRTVLLSAENESPIQLGVNFHHNLPGQFRGAYVHLYILSEDLIEISDHVLATIDKKQHTFKCNSKISQANCQANSRLFKKIVASTDSSLNLPSPSPEFLQIYCQDEPTEVLVDYKLGSYKRGLIWLPQINKDNQISIEKAKQTYTEEEVEILLIKAFRDGHIWGVSYSTWFVPTKKQHKEELQKCLDSLM
jgi:hypothetical protein